MYSWIDLVGLNATIIGSSGGEGADGRIAFDVEEYDQTKENSTSSFGKVPQRAPPLSVLPTSFIAFMIMFNQAGLKIGSTKWGTIEILLGYRLGQNIRLLLNDAERLYSSDHPASYV